MPWHLAIKSTEIHGQLSQTNAQLCLFAWVADQQGAGGGGPGSGVLTSDQLLCRKIRRRKMVSYAFFRDTPYPALRWQSEQNAHTSGAEVLENKKSNTQPPALQTSNNSSALQTAAYKNRHAARGTGVVILQLKYTCWIYYYSAELIIHTHANYAHP